MRETINETSLIRRPVLRVVLHSGVAIAAALTVFAFNAANNQVLAQSQTQTNNSAPTASSSQDGAMTPNEILALFEREAKAAYAMNKQACDGLDAEEQKICLARARLQFDEDMRYAQKRAAQGY